MTDDSIRAVCDAFLRGEDDNNTDVFIHCMNRFLRLHTGVWLYRRDLDTGEIIKWREIDEWMSASREFKEADRLVMRAVVEYMDTILYAHESSEELPYLGIHI